MQYDRMTGFYKADKEVDVMPSIELIEYEEVSYIKEMKEYLKNLKGMSRAEAEKVSHDNLVKSRIIEENGEFTEQYQYARMNMQKKR